MYYSIFSHVPLYNNDLSIYFFTPLAISVHTFVMVVTICNLLSSSKSFEYLFWYCIKRTAYLKSISKWLLFCYFYCLFTFLSIKLSIMRFKTRYSTVKYLHFPSCTFKFHFRSCFWYNDAKIFTVILFRVFSKLLLFCEMSPLVSAFISFHFDLCLVL